MSSLTTAVTYVHQQDILRILRREGLLSYLGGPESLCHIKKIEEYYLLYSN